MQSLLAPEITWIRRRIRREEIERYQRNGRDFIDEAYLQHLLDSVSEPDSNEVKSILAKAESIQTLDLPEVAKLIRVQRADLWEEMKETAARIKKKVYDNRIVTFAPLYLSNRCVNNCAYCGLRAENSVIQRRTLSMEEIVREVEVLAGKIGHKRVIAVFGEHPDADIEYMIKAMRTIYSVKVKARVGFGQIRRININAPPLPIEELKVLKSAGLGTYQVFQETYHPRMYRQLHPARTIKGDYSWRLYAMHRALEAGIDDVGIGCLFGLYDWRFEVLALVQHARELEAMFGVGPHTISFPRLEPAENTPFVQQSQYAVSDGEMERVIVILRLSVPYAGMILTARERPDLRRRFLPLGCTQTDASSRVGVGAYAGETESEYRPTEQFYLGDMRSLDEVVRELAEMGYITSFCTAGYRCGRTGKCIMELLRSGKEGKFCKLNAVLTFREWLDDFASPATRLVGEKILEKELKEIQEQNPVGYRVFMEYYRRVAAGERDLYL